MKILKEFEKLLEQKKLKLLFVQMDKKFDNETYADLLGVDFEKIQSEQAELEVKLKHKLAKKEKEAMTDRLKKINELINRVLGIQKEVLTLNREERDYKEYILFMEKYIKDTRWEE